MGDMQQNVDGGATSTTGPFLYASVGEGSPKPGSLFQFGTREGPPREGDASSSTLVVLPQDRRDENPHSQGNNGVNMVMVPITMNALGNAPQSEVDHTGEGAISS